MTSTAPERTYFTLTDEAHLELALMRDHARYITRLLESGAAANLAEEEHRPDVMTWWIGRMYRDLHRIVESGQWSGLAGRSGGQ